MSVRSEASKILNFTITVSDGNTNWDECFRLLQTEGRLTSKHMIDLIKLLLKKEESRENK